MKEFSADDYIEEQNGNHESVNDQKELSKLLYELGITYDGEEKKKSEIVDLASESDIEFDCQPGTALDNLLDIDIVERFKPSSGGDWVVISERRDDVVFDEITETLAEDQAQLIQHIHDEDPHDGEKSVALDGGALTLRLLLSDEFGVGPEKVEEHLQRGDEDRQREKLNQAIDAIEESEIDKRSTYGKIVWKRVAYRYQIPEWAISRFAS